MKTRVQNIQVSVVALNPYNGWEAELPIELYNEYMEAFHKFDASLSRIAEVLRPQAVNVDKMVAEHQDRKGLKLLEVPEDS